MNRHSVEVTISGAEVSPEQVPLRDLVDVLARIERLVSSYFLATVGELPEGPVLSLVDIRPGSESLVFSTIEPVIPAWAGISKAIEERAYSELPSTTYQELWDFSQSLERRGWGLEIRENAELEIRRATIGSTDDLVPPHEPVFVRGTTTLHGRCLRVGGATQPKAEIRLSTSNRILNVELAEDTAKELAKRLYEEVVLEGQATWNAETWEITRFRVSSLSDYRVRDPADSFEELAQAAEGRWEGVDAAEYVHGLRVTAE